MLDANPKMRITAPNVLAHPFFTEKNNKSSLTIPNLEVFTSSSTLDNTPMIMSPYLESEETKIEKKPEFIEKTDKKIKFKGGLKVKVYRFPPVDIMSPNMEEMFEKSSSKTKSTPTSEERKKQLVPIKEVIVDDETKKTEN